MRPSTLTRRQPTRSCSFARTVSERRRAEIAEKRARLAALRAAREQREAAAARTAASSPSADSYASGHATTPTDTALDRSTAATTTRASLGAASSRGDEIENLLRGVGVVGRERERTAPSTPSSPSRTAERSSTPSRQAAEGQDGSASQRAKESEATEAAGSRSAGTSSERSENAPEEEVTPPGDSK